MLIFVTKYMGIKQTIVRTRKWNMVNIDGTANRKRSGG